MNYSAENTFQIENLNDLNELPQNVSIFDRSANLALNANQISLLENFTTSNVVQKAQNEVNKSRNLITDKSLVPIENERGTICTHQNLRSINNKFAEIQIRLTGSKIDFHGFSETWLHKNISDAEINIPGFSIIRTDRNSNKNGGGVCLYYKNNRSVRTLASLATSDFEILLVELILERCKSTIIGIVYKPPDGNTDNLTEALENILNEHMYNKDVLNMGDFNIDASKENPSD